MNSWWSKSYWFTPMQMNFASTTTVPSGDGGSSGSPGSGGGGSPTGGGGANTSGGSGSNVTPPGGTGAPPSPAPAQINWESAPAQFREGYNKLKGELEQLSKQYEPWKGLGVQPEQVTQYQQSYQQVYGEMKGIADNLGIEEREIADAIKIHGVLPVLDQLRHEAQQAEAANAGDPAAVDERNLEERLNAVAERVLSPIQQRENVRITHEANQLTERTITELASAAFKAQGADFMAAPAPLRDFILTGVTEVLKYDDAALNSIKFEGKTAGIQKAYQTFTAMWDAAYLARRQMEQGAPRVPAPPGRVPANQGNGKKPTFDEMIDNPDSIRAAGGRPAYST